MILIHMVTWFYSPTIVTVLILNNRPQFHREALDYIIPHLCAFVAFILQSLVFSTYLISTLRYHRNSFVISDKGQYSASQRLFVVVAAHRWIECVLVSPEAPRAIR